MTESKSTAIVKADQATTLAKLEPILKRMGTVEDDPTPRMVDVIMNADNPEQWEQLFAAASTKGNVGRAVRVHDLRWLQSAYPESFGFFLVADVTWLDSGERGVLSTGSKVTVAQLLKAYDAGWLPRDFEIVEKPTETRLGYKPIHLRALPKRVGVAQEA